jgi:hypothetical protein
MRSNLRVLRDPPSVQFFLARVPTPVWQDKITEQLCQHRWGVESTNHHCRGRISRDKYCENNSPRGDQEKRSKIDMAKQDLKDRV